jgi:hypothetical protein
MAKNVKLRATQGADEANVDGVKYRVNNDGTVEVPQEAAPHLMGVGGFVEAEPNVPDLPEDHVRVAHDDATGLSFGGVSYERHEDGSFHVPAHAVAHLVAHGFVALEEPIVTTATKPTGVPKLKTLKV